MLAQKKYKIKIGEKIRQRRQNYNEADNQKIKFKQYLYILGQYPLDVTNDSEIKEILGN